MANDAGTLRGYLATQLRDSTYETWASAELDTLIASAVRACPRRPLLHDEVTQVLSSGIYYYTLPQTVTNISRLDLVDSSGEEQGELGGGLWEIIGDMMSGDAELHIAPTIVDANDGATVNIIGYGDYGTTGHYIPDDYVPFVLAHARAEAYARMISSRARFKNWANSDQTLNISVNELVQLVNDAQSDRERQRSMIARIRKPMPARLAQ
jgi:hypothetical protein